MDVSAFDQDSPPGMADAHLQEDSNMTTGMIFVICVLIFVGVSVLTAIFVYKSQMRKKRMQQSQDQVQGHDSQQNVR